MTLLSRRRFLSLIGAILAAIAVFHLLPWSKVGTTPTQIDALVQSGLIDTGFTWSTLPQRYPVENHTALPTGPVIEIPKIQFDFPKEKQKDKTGRESRLEAVKEAFVHTWAGYKRNAWLQDEVAPLSGDSNNGFGGWGATLIDSLDTLWIMGLKKDFAIAVAEVRKIDFTSTPLDKINVFETTIRYLGGLLSAYDVSGQRHEILLQKAVELGNMLYAAFDTPNRMPVTRWDWKNAATGGEQESDIHSLLAEVGSLSLEFTRLSQLTGDPKWYDAVARITNVLEGWQNHTKIPGLWPQMLDTRHLDFRRHTTFTLGGMSDSFYEYMPKQHLMLGGRNDQYRSMYSVALESARENLLFRPLNPSNQQILLSGTLKRHSAVNIEHLAKGEHLGCFAGGMVALAAKVFQQIDELETARQLVDGCLWAYDSMPSGLMPETFTAVACHRQLGNCTWSQDKWYNAVDAHINSITEAWIQPSGSAEEVIAQYNLPQGMVEIADSRYNLRPEAIESLFVLYRITGDQALQDKAWKMFESINSATRTNIAYASVSDVTERNPELEDSMESFWAAETLKYFYLIFSEPEVISLDEYVLNTEAHPLLRPTE